MLQDGTIFGTLCAVDPEPHELAPTQADLLMVLARLVATVIERDRELASRTRAEAQLQQQAWYDGLTGLPNRLLLSERLQHALAAGRRRDAQPFAVFLLDLDRFKPINDDLGHSAGDALLIEVAHRLRGSVRPGDTVARWGGDEFVLLLANIGDPRHVSQAAERIRQSLAAPFHLHGHTAATSASVGIVMGPGSYERPSELLRDADIAMYRAKAQGKAQAVIFDPAMHRQTVARLWLEGDLRRAIVRDELAVYYQPIVDSATGRLCRLEAFVRWQHPERGVIPPAEFLPLAEETGYVRELDTWVLHHVCKQLQAWRAAGHSPVPVAINVSLRQVTDPAFGALLRDNLMVHGVAPTDVTLEMAEHTLTAALRAAGQALHEIRRTGVQLWLDNFGAGAFSLSLLHELSVDGVKIDRSLVDGLPGDERQAAFAEALVALTGRLRLGLVVEGVETRAQHDALRGHGARLMQGHLFGVPVAAHAVLPYRALQFSHPPP